MRSAAFFLALDGDAWHAARVVGDQVEASEVPAAGVDNPGDAAGKAAEALRELGYSGQGVCLGLPSDMVLAARIDCSNLPRKNRGTAMIYRLEEELPLDAERLTVDFTAAGGAWTLGAAVETARVVAIIDALTEAGIETAAVCPTALLALWHCCRDGAEPGEYTIVAGRAQVDVFRTAEHHPAAWHSLPCDAPELSRCIRSDLLAHPVDAEHLRGRVVGQLAADLAVSVQRDTGITLVPSGDESPFFAAAHAAGETLSGHRAGWLDFRRDELAVPNPWARVAGLLRSSVVLGLMLFVAAAGMLYWRAARYDGIARQYEKKQAAVYRKLYPNCRVPPSVKSRLKSELARLAGISGTGLEVPDQPSALDSLRQVVANLPPAVRLRIVEMRIDPGGILVEGQTRTHSDAEVISQALRRGGFAVDPPRTERLVRGGVAFTLVGKPSGDKRLAAAEGSGQ